MKSWNRTGKLKALFLFIIFIPNIIFPKAGNQNDGFESVILGFIFGLFVIPLLIKVNSFIFKQKLEMPDWNDNPLTFTKPLRFFHFMSYFFFISGLSIVIGTGVGYQQMNIFGLMAISAGVSTLLGIKFMTRGKE